MGAGPCNRSHTEFVGPATVTEPEPSAAPDAGVVELSGLLGDKAIVAVADVADPVDAAQLARVLGDSGVDGLEITFRRPNAAEALAYAVEPGSLPVGAGTMVSTATADAAVEAGAVFLVSPGIDEQIVRHGRSLGVPTTPGVLTPSEVQAAMRLGCSEVKLFPAGLFGGLQLLGSLSSVFTGMTFMPTGGIDHDGALEYLEQRSVFAVGGSWIAPTDLISQGRWSEIARRATSIRDDVDRLR